MSGVEFGGFWLAVACYATATASAVGGIVFRRDRPVTIAFFLCSVGLLAHLVAVVARMIHVGHLPIVSRYENVLVVALFVMLFAVLLVLRRKNLGDVLAFAAPLTLLNMGYAFVHRPDVTRMSPVLDNFWMFVHVFFAWLAYGAYFLAAALGILFVLRERNEGRAGETATFYNRLPSPAVLDNIIFRAIIFGFVTHAAMIASGAVWARDLWGSYWSWDPVETWSLVSWLVYGLVIHLKVTLGWKGRRTALLVIAALLTVFMSFWGTNLFSETRHSLDEFMLKISEER